MSWVRRAWPYAITLVVVLYSASVLYHVYSTYYVGLLGLFSTSPQTAAGIRGTSVGWSDDAHAANGEAPRHGDLVVRVAGRDVPSAIHLQDVGRLAKSNQLGEAIDVATLADLEKLPPEVVLADEYAVRRDLPAVPGTSQMSIYLKNGSITTAQILGVLGLEDVRPPAKQRKAAASDGAKRGAVKGRAAQGSAAQAGARRPDSRTTYVKELAWREFYYHVLYHRPDVEGEAFLEKYRGLRWRGREAWFEAWKAGRTGFPIVDAGMRQLNQTGWMHNRVRMIVASFLTKDLLIDWRQGERYFMERLLDGDLAPNNGGWQWAASTGCDPQPYFRVFNPKLQGEKFDPEGEYVRRWVPELADVPTKHIHAPHEAGHGTKYGAPIVDHAEQKKRALEMYRRV